MQSSSLPTSSRRRRVRTKGRRSHGPRQPLETPALLRRSACSLDVEEVLDLLNALNLPRALLEILDQLGLLDLAAEDDGAVLGVDIDLTLRHLGIAKDLGLDLAGERDVVGLRLLGLLAVLDLLRGTLSLGRDGSPGLLDAMRAPSKEGGNPVARKRAPAASAFGIEKVGDQGPEAHVSE